MSKKKKNKSGAKDALKKKSKTTDVPVALITVVAVFVLGMAAIWFFSSGSDEDSTNISIPGQKIDVSADTTKMLVPEEMVVSGGTTQEIVDSMENGAAATVNGEPIDAGILAYAVNNKGTVYAQSLLFTGAINEPKNFDWNEKDPNFGGTYLEYVRFSALEELIPGFALVAEGKRRGVVLSEQDIKEIEDWLATEKGDMSDEEFERKLAESGCYGIDTFVAFRTFSVLEAKVKADFEKNPDKYATREQLLNAEEREMASVQHILVAFNPDNPSAEYTDEMKNKARSRAESVLAKVNSGEDFSTLADEYNDDVQFEYTLGENDDYEESFKNAVFSLDVGQVSDIVETSYGYHIIKRIERIPTITDYMILLNKNAKVVINREVFNDILVTVDFEKYADTIFSAMSN